MRRIGEIIENLLNIVKEDNTRMLIRELNNACGSQISELKEQITSNMRAESVTVNNEEYISLDTAIDIVITAGNKL